MEVLEKYFKSNRYFISKHHLDSYNDFVLHKLPNTIKVLNPIRVLKNQDNGIITHEIEVFIGNESGDAIYLRQPFITEENIKKPLLPNAARLKDLTYSVELFADITIKYTTRNKQSQQPKVEVISIKDVKIGEIPIMLHSCLCILENKPPHVLRELGECVKDIGGYFIVDGKEKVIVAQERIATNRIFINKSNDDKYSYSGMVRCTSLENPLFPKTINIYVHKDEIKKNAASPRNSIVITLPGLKDHIIPLFVLFRALGVESDYDILQHIVNDVENPINKKLLDFLYFSIIASKDCMTQDDALTFLANRVEYQSRDKVNHILMHDVFPNVGTGFSEKALFLGHVIHKLARVAIGADKESDRDNYLYKRVDISGFLIGNLFRDYYNQFRNTIRNRIDQQYLYGPWRTSSEIKNLINKNNFYIIFDRNIITNGMLKSLKGNWGRSMVEEKVDLDSIKQGIVQDVSRISFMGFTSHLRRVNTPIDPTAKVVAPHRLHPTQWGVMCPCESPDGGSIGLLKNFAIMCHVTFDSPIDDIKKHLKELGLQPMMKSGVCKIMINSNWIGNHDDPPKLFATLKKLKRHGKIDKYTSISWNVFSSEINILTEAGRCTRPLFIVEDGKPVYDPNKHGNMSWDEMISSGIIEYMDVEEIGYAYVAMRERDLNKYHTHLEIHPSTVFSVVTHNIPLANHNQAPRNVFFGAQGKQAIGVYATNFNDRIDTMSYVMHYPQKAIVGTKFMEYIGNNELPAGANLIVAIASYTGYNQEDSIIINKGAIERGLFNLTYYKNIIEKEDENKKDNETLIFANPLKMTQEGIDLKNIKYAKYGKLDDQGFPKLNTFISEGDAIVGKTLIKKELSTPKDEALTLGGLFDDKVVDETYMDKSVIADKTVSGIIDRIIIYPDQKGNKTCKIRMRKTRVPEFGDKQASRSGQKGVIGAIVSPENMPFNHEKGIVPDIIINPHAIPSRMTIAHLLECILCKSAVSQGCTVDGTPFNDFNYEEFINTLETKFGLEKYGNEILYNGFNGRQIETEIFFGPTYYMRLKHMVSDKINYRSSGGPVTVRTRQPTKGRSKGGALRFGEMEMHCHYSHGFMHFMKESLMERSDNYMFAVNNKTGDILISPKDADDVSYVKAPYSLKLMLQELATMGVKAQLVTNSVYNDKIEEEEFETFDDVEVENMSEVEEDEDV